MKHQKTGFLIIRLEFRKVNKKNTLHNNKYSACRSFFFTEKELVNLKIVKPKKIIE